MRAAAPQTRLDNDISRFATWRSATLGAAMVALAAALPAAPLRAQSTNRAAAPPCTEIEVDAERLACYDRALRGARPAAPTPPAAPVAAAPAAAPAAPKADSRHARGSDAKDAKAEQPIVSVVVVNVRGRPGENTFTTDNGDTWVQIDGRATTLPNLPFAATVKPGMSASFFLVPTKGRAIRVRPGD